MLRLQEQTSTKRIEELRNNPRFRTVSQYTPPTPQPRSPWDRKWRKYFAGIIGVMLCSVIAIMTYEFLIPRPRQADAIKDMIARYRRDALHTNRWHTTSSDRRRHAKGTNNPKPTHRSATPSSARVCRTPISKPAANSNAAATVKARTAPPADSARGSLRPRFADFCCWLRPSIMQWRAPVLHLFHCCVGSRDASNRRVPDLQKPR